ncbi:immunoglobulin superfamily member 10 [Periophthalmus magnuspinnatus]|uniref:immunoglobulin superfamily member 10 n=1 Tax=Periophthalmus magnuspinnatus TaxID=409849 RepID=UPI00145A7F22|nr:immunoglobulin superfamily member 10 [Periophthalmus magnuspinnatus]
MSERASYLWGGVLRTLLILLTACSTAEGGRCPKSCSCHVPNEVHCTFRYLTSVPEHIQPTVEKMNLGYNSIAMLKENDLTGLKNLELLMLHSNTIHNTEDGAFKDLKSLQVLKMSYNKLKKINKETFTGLESVIRLHLDHNHLEFIHPNAFYGLTTLQLVNLEGNYLQQIHSHTFITLRYNQLFAVSSVKTIHLSDNLLSSLPADTFPSSVQLENLFLHGNPWSCDCRMAWFTKWRIMNVGVLKCKRDRRGQLCPVCQNPSIHHNKTLSLISSDAFICTRPAIQPHLKNKNITLDEGEYSQLLPKDFIAPLGSIQINLTDHFHNEGSLSCTVQRPSASENLTLVSGEDGTNHITVTMTTYLICNVDHEHMPQLWQILAIYSDSPMQLRRGEMTAKTPEMKYRYSQMKPMDEDDDFHTNIEAVIKASPALLMQPEINLQLDRTATTFSTLYVKYQSVVNLGVDNTQTNRDGYSWTVIKRDNQTKTQLTAVTGAVAQFSCEVVGEPKPIMEWILPDGSKVRAPYSSEDKRLLISADGKCTIRGVAPSDIGLYHCIATNYLDADILTFRLNVLSPDVEDDEINGLQLTKPLGERLMLECGATGSPKPSIKWILPDHSILESSQDKKKVYENGSLVVESLTKRDRGFYRCQVSNQLGVDLLVSHVLVTGEEPKAVTVLDQDEENILDKTNVDKVDTENPSIGKASQESRTVTSDRPYPRLRSRDREHLESRLGHRRRGPFSSRNRVLHRSYKKLDPERFAQFLNNIKNKERTHSGSNTESNIFSGDGDVSSGENPDDVILPQLVKPITTKPENLGTTESYFQHRPTQTNNLVTLKYFPESQSNAPYVTVLQNKHYPTFNEPTDVYTLERTSNIAFNVHPVTAQRLEDPETSTGAAISFTTDPHVTPMRDGTGPLVYTSTDPDHQTTFTAVTTAERQQDEITWHTTQTIKSPSLHSGSTIISRQHFHIIPHKNGRAGGGGGGVGGGRRKLFPGRRRIVKPNRITDIQSFISKVKQKKDGNSTVPYTIQVTTECECGNDGAKTAVRDVQVLTPTASPAKRPTSIQYTNTNSDIPLKQPTHAGPRELPSTRDYITSADAPESAPTTDPVLITNQEASETTKGRISWNRPLRRENTGSYARKPSITPTISTTAETTTVTATTTPAAVPTIEANGIVIPATIFTPTHSHVKENSGDDDFGEFSADFEFTTQKPRYQAYTTASYYSSTITQTLAESQTLPSPPTVKPPTAINEDVISGSGGLPNIWFGRKKPSGTKGRHGQRRKPIRGRRPTNKDHADPPRTRGTTKLPKVTTKSPATSYTEQESVFTSGRSSRFTTHAPRMTSARTYSTTLMPTTTRAFYPTAFSRVPDNITPTQKVTTYRPQITRPVLKSTISSGQRRTNTPSYQSNSLSKVHPSVTTGQSATIVSRVPFESTSILMTSKPRIIGGNAASFTVLSDSDAFLPCDAVGNPQPTISWRRFSTITGNTMSIMGKVGKFAVLENGTLLIQNANIKDRGQYLCLAENNQGSDKLLVTLSVVAYPSRILEPKMRELKSHTGNRVEISCKAEGRPAPMITWILANRTQVRGQKSQGRVTVSDQGTLVIEQVSVYDRGHYKCIASNPAGADTASVKLQVVAAPPGILEEKRQVIRISATQNIWLPCTSIGSPQPTIHWVLFDGTVIPTNRGIRGSRITVHHNGTLHIKDVLLSDSGKYECIATSSTGSERRVVTLMVEKYETMPQIMQISQRLTELYFGDQLTLNCTAKGEPTPRIIWRLPSKAVVDQWHRMGSRMQVLENGTLLINSVSDKDAGEYLCVARNTIGDDLQLLRVRVSMKPAKIETKLLDKKQVTFGKDLKVDCKASGAPKPEISWGLPDGTVVNSVYQSDSSIGGGGGGGRTRRYTLFDNGTLYLNQVGMSEEGDYTCYAENQVGKDEMHVHITVVTAAPHIHTPAQAQVRVKSRGNVRLDCHAVGEPKPKILWMLPSKDVIAASNERYLVHVNGSLEIRDVKLGDVGDYICKARNPAGESRKVYKVEIDGNIPMINGYNQNRTVIKDIAAKYSRKLMDCKAEGDPTPTVTWIMPDNIFLSAPYFGSRINVHHNGTLEIKNVRPTDTAEFICIARNDGGEAVMVVQLQVIGTMQRPIFKNPFNERIVSRIGKTVVLNCSASGHPAPEIFWTLPNGTRFNQIQGHISRHHVSNDGSLVIHSSQKEDAGKYRCGAKNYMGYIEKLVLLEVGQQPYILTRPRGIIRSVSGEPLFLHCLSDGNPRPSISWTLPGGHTLARPQVLGRYQLLENGTLIIQDTTAHDRGSYVCRARNEAGEAVLTVPVLIIAYPPRITTGPPASVRAIRGAPLQLHCVAVGIPKAEITWELPNHSLLSTAEQGWPTGSELLHPQGTLIIQRPTLSDSGTYKCLAKNYLGTDAKATYVRVL